MASGKPISFEKKSKSFMPNFKKHEKSAAAAAGPQITWAAGWLAGFELAKLQIVFEAPEDTTSVQYC